MELSQRRAWLAWASVGLLALLCGVLAVLQYRWIGEITSAERTRLRTQLQSRLNALSRTFNEAISTACGALVPEAAQVEQLGRERAYSAQYLRWKQSHEPLFHRIALAVPDSGPLRLLLLDLDTAAFSPSDWPPEWSATRDQLMRRFEGGPVPMAQGVPVIFEVPRFEAAPDGRGAREQEWLLAELDAGQVAATLLPQLLNRYLGESGRLDYDAEVVDSANPAVVIYDSEPGRERAIRGSPDASVGLLNTFGFGLRGGRGGPGRGPMRMPLSPRDGPHDVRRSASPGASPDVQEGIGRGSGTEPPPPEGGPGRWRLLVRHQAGSLDALVASTRRRNLAISAAILLLILATICVLVRFSRRAHQLAELQMNFVAGVSHELRTPLTVIHTAAYNLRGRLAGRPEQVEKYGALIQAESAKLTMLVEQVLHFASAQAGHVIRAREPVAVDRLIDDGLRSSGAALRSAGFTLEKQLDPGLPLVLADEMAMRHVLQNLVDNALKYGVEGGNWIGVFASAVSDRDGPAVEIRVADRGSGIPQDEQEHIFDPFFRGRQAVRDQVHGTGLGLNLVKKIVEAHGGSIRVKSEPMKGTEFIVRIPAAPPELQNELAHSPD